MMIGTNKKQLFLPALLFISIFFFANAALADTITVHSFGNGDLLTGVISAVAQLKDSDAFKMFMTIMFLLGGFAALIRGGIAQVSGRDGWKTFMAWMVAISIVNGVAFLKTTTVNVHDEILNTDSGAISNVPISLALLMSTTTSAEKDLAEAFDTFFSTPDFAYTESGYGMGALSLVDALQAAPYSTRTATNWNYYIVDCVIPALMHGDIDEVELLSSDNILGENLLNVSVPLYTWYINNNNQREHYPCSQVYSLIRNDLDADLDQIKKGYAYKVLGDANFAVSQGFSITKVLDMFESAAERYLDVANSGEELLKQAVVVNLIGASTQDVLAEYSGNPDAYLLANVAAKLQMRNTLATSAAMAKTFIPAIRQIIEAIIYGIFPIVVGVLFVPGMGMRVLRSYISLFLWLLWWSPVYSILNYIVDIRAQNVFYAIHESGMGHFSIAVWPQLLGSGYDVIGFAANMLWFVPLLSYALATGSGYAMVSLASNIGGQLKSIASAAGAQTSATPGGIQATTSMGQTLTEADMAQKVYGMSWRELARDTALLSPRVHRTGWAHTHGISEAVQSVIGQTGDTMTAGTFMGDTTGMIRGLEAQKYASNILDYARTHGMDASSLINTLQGLKVGTMGANAIAIQNIADRAFGGNVYRALDFLKQTGLEKEFGNLKGLHKAHETAVKNGFEGDFVDFIKYTAAREALNEYAKMEQRQKGSEALTHRSGLDAFLKGSFLKHAAMDMSLDPETAENLNRIAEQNNWKTRFKAGDRVNLAWWTDDKGRIVRISVAKAHAGAERFEADLTTQRGTPFTLNIGGQKIAGLTGEQVVEGNYVKSKTVMNTSQLAQLQKALLEKKYYKAADGIADIITQGKSANVETITTKDGQIVGVRVNNEALVGDKDTFEKAQTSTHKAGDFYEVGEATLNDIVIRGNYHAADPLAGQWFIADSEGKIRGLSEKGVTFVKNAANVITGFGGHTKTHDTGGQIRTGVSSAGVAKKIQHAAEGIAFGAAVAPIPGARVVAAGAAAVAGLLSLIDVKAEKWNRASEDERADLIKSGIMREAQQIAMNSPGTAKEKGEAIAAYLHSVYQQIQAIASESKTEMVLGKDAAKAIDTLKKMSDFGDHLVQEAGKSPWYEHPVGMTPENLKSVEPMAKAVGEAGEVMAKTADALANMGVKLTNTAPIRGKISSRYPYGKLDFED
jgi:hypothetical protein